LFFNLSIAKRASIKLQDTRYSCSKEHMFLQKQIWFEMNRNWQVFDATIKLHPLGNALAPFWRGPIDSCMQVVKRLHLDLYPLFTPFGVKTGRVKIILIETYSFTCSVVLTASQSTWKL
jgi:hypothetical protein